MVFEIAPHVEEMEEKEEDWSGESFIPRGTGSVTEQSIPSHCIRLGGVRIIRLESKLIEAKEVKWSWSIRFEVETAFHFPLVTYHTD